MSVDQQYPTKKFQSEVSRLLRRQRKCPYLSVFPYDQKVTKPAVYIEFPVLIPYTIISYSRSQVPHQRQEIRKIIDGLKKKARSD